MFEKKKYEMGLKKLRNKVPTNVLNTRRKKRCKVNKEVEDLIAGSKIVKF